MNFFTLFSQNFLSAPILFFVLGVLLGWIKSPLKLPEALSKTIIYFLMISIGLQGGLKITATEGGAALSKGFLVAFGFSFFSPFLFNFILKKTTGLPNKQSAIFSMYYGSISIVTFVAGINFLHMMEIDFEAHLIAMAALMEIPAILSGFIILSLEKKKEEINWPVLLKEVFLNPSIVLLISSFFIGLIANSEGKNTLKDFFVSPFQGIMCLFLLEMGLSVATKFVGFHQIKKGLLVFSIVSPIVLAAVGSLAGYWIELSFGGAILFGVLCASASYVAVPAVIRATFPDFDQSTPLSLSLGVTFPFNVILCIPLIFHLNSYLYGI